MCVVRINTLRNNLRMLITWRQLAKTRMKQLGLTQERLAETLGKTQGAIGHWLNGRREPGIEDIAAIMKALDLKELVLSASGMVIYPDELLNNVSDPRPHSEVKSFPVISWVSAGNWSEAVDPYNQNDFLEWSQTTAKASEKCFWLTVKGDSMTASTGLSIPEGMKILVDPAIEPTSGRLVVAKLESQNEATFKKYIVDTGQKYLKPLNPNYHMIPIDNDCRIIGVVIEAKFEQL